MPSSSRVAQTSAGGQVSEPLAVQHVQDRLALGRGQRPRLDPLGMRDRGGRGGGGLARCRR